MIRKRLATYRRGQQLEADEISSRRPWMKAIASNASRNAIHSVICFRSIDWWREAVERAAKKEEKYVALATFLVEIEEENRSLK